MSEHITAEECDPNFCPECEHPRGACICEQSGADDDIGADAWDGEGLEGDDELSNCHAFVDGGVFVCGAVGSEDCDQCPFNCELGTKAEFEPPEEESDD
jgi:hypothetical protein